MKTYYAARDLSIQSRAIKRGDVVGTGDVAKGEFTAAPGLERFVELGHVEPRLADGRITDTPPGQEEPAVPPRKPVPAQDPARAAKLDAAIPPAAKPKSKSKQTADE